MTKLKNLILFCPISSKSFEATNSLPIPETRNRVFETERSRVKKKTRVQRINLETALCPSMSHFSSKLLRAVFPWSTCTGLQTSVKILWTVSRNFPSYLSSPSHVLFLFLFRLQINTIPYIGLRILKYIKTNLIILIIIITTFVQKCLIEAGKSTLFTYCKHFPVFLILYAFFDARSTFCV